MQCTRTQLWKIFKWFNIQSLHIFFVLGSDTFSQMQLFLLPYLKQRICIVHCHIPKWNGGTDDTTHLFSYQPRICCRWWTRGRRASGRPRLAAGSRISARNKTEVIEWVLWIPDWIFPTWFQNTHQMWLSVQGTDKIQKYLKLQTLS